MDNGDRISGEVIAIEDDILVLETGYSGRVRIDTTRIERLSDTDENVARNWGRHWEKEHPSAPLHSSKDASEEKPAGRTEKQEEAESPWSGTLEIGFAAVEAANTRQEYLVDVENSWAVDDDRLDLNAELRHERAKGDTLVDKQHIGTAYNRYLSERFFIAPGIRYRRDSVADLERRITTVMQAGYDVFDSERQSLSFQAGPGYLRERIEGDGVYEDFLATWGVDYDRRLSNLIEGVSFFHEQSGATGVYGDTGRLLFDMETGLRYKIFGDLYLAGIMELELDSAPRGRADQFERTLRLRLGYKW
ncbi:DUF481 domain-containing protein [Fodinicurvata sediminis]|uniref:DUF481 domain-containing protein n=1 Tax=Fodinicurvata sediminis TaxID=1121832 RepID=UPI0003FA23CE|nr:DUF481 domain-containing protein [Fodinicurvata sediminis]